MKKSLILSGLLLLSGACFASEPSFWGTHLSSFPYGYDGKDWIGYPQNNASSAGVVYLYSKKINTVDFVAGKKNEFMNRAKEEARSFAVKKNRPNYAVTNLSFQIVRSDKFVDVYADYYVIAW